MSSNNLQRTMQKQKTPIKLISLKTKGYHSETDRITELELQLRQARSHITVLKDANRLLMEKLQAYDRKYEDLKVMEEELEFRREQQRQMQQHLDNYQEINAKLREQINELEAALKNKNLNSCGRSPYQRSQSEIGSKVSSRHLSVKDENISSAAIEQGRRSLYESSKQNHPLTPKSRVSINLDAFTRNELNSMHQINARRKVFM